MLVPLNIMKGTMRDLGMVTEGEALAWILDWSSFLVARALVVVQLAREGLRCVIRLIRYDA